MDDLNELWRHIDYTKKLFGIIKKIRVVMGRRYTLFIFLAVLLSFSNGDTITCDTSKTTILEPHTKRNINLVNDKCKLESTGYMSYGFWFVWFVSNFAQPDQEHQ